jgi:hypothetical protein
MHIPRDCSEEALVELGFTTQEIESIQRRNRIHGDVDPILLDPLKVGQKMICDSEEHADSFAMFLKMSFAFYPRLVNAYREYKRGRNASPSSDQPPSSATFLMHLVPQKHQQFMLGDLIEEFESVREAFGIRKARFVFWWHVIWSIVSCFWDVTTSVVIKAMKQG